MKRIRGVTFGLPLKAFAYGQSAGLFALSKGGLLVIFENDTLFHVYSKIGPYEPLDSLITKQYLMEVLRTCCLNMPKDYCAPACNVSYVESKFSKTND